MHWSQDCQMLFNIDKSKVMHFGFNNEVVYILGIRNLVQSKRREILGVIIDKSLTSSWQCAKVAAVANSVLGMIRRTFLCKDKELILQLCKSLIRTRLEYCMQAWRPYLKKDIKSWKGCKRKLYKFDFRFFRSGLWRKIKNTGFNYSRNKKVKRGLKGDMQQFFTKLIKK